MRTISYIKRILTTERCEDVERKGEISRSCKYVKLTGRRTDQRKEQLEWPGSLSRKFGSAQFGRSATDDVVAQANPCSIASSTQSKCRVGVVVVVVIVIGEAQSRWMFQMSGSKERRSTVICTELIEYEIVKSCLVCAAVALTFIGVRRSRACTYVSSPRFVRRPTMCAGMCLVASDR